MSIGFGVSFFVGYHGRIDYDAFDICSMPDAIVSERNTMVTLSQAPTSPQVEIVIGIKATNFFQTICA